MKIYSQDEVEQIFTAYRDIFPEINPPLSKYLGLERKRKWSNITTNFHLASYEQLEQLHMRALEIDEKQVPIEEKGRLLRDASIETGVGFSAGICPWTDNLLLKTYAKEKNKVTILLGHDWYPIIPKNGRYADSPLRSTDNLHSSPKYLEAVPQAVFDGSSVGLFFNLYPDYRPPGDETCGSLSNDRYDMSYEECLVGLDTIIDYASSRFEKVSLVSWGDNVWKTLKSRVQHDCHDGIMKQAKIETGKVLKFESLGKVIEYLPIAHPSHSGNFLRSYHKNHVKTGFSKL